MRLMNTILCSMIITEPSLYQAESQIIKAVGDQPGITASELSREFHKTNSACSQLIRKLKKKEWIRQERNEKNNREYNPLSDR